MAEMTAITDSMYLSSKVTPTKSTGNSELGKDAFLQILMAQLQNQDPTKPMDDSQFIAQMAQFSSLEQMTNLTTAFEKFAEVQEQNQVIEYSNFVGKQVKWHELTKELDEENNPITAEGTGTISAIQFVDGGAEFTLADGKVITPGNISEVISNGINSNSLVDASMVIGKTVTYTSKETESTARVESVSKKSGNIVYNLAGGVSITAEQINLIK
jgi:flagellar basal-body rod modification protein FlgD